ncbi:MAG: hypothetical protein ACOCWX_05025 [Spirochaetota bacterium]
MRVRRTGIVLILLSLLASTAFGQSGAPRLATHYQPGNVAFSLGAGFGFGGRGVGVSLYPGAEFIVAKIRPADVLSIDFGAGARGGFTFRSYGTTPAAGYIALGGAPFVSAHMGLRGFTGNEVAEYLDRIDIYTAFGLGYLAYVPTGAAGAIDGGLAFANFSGVNYFLTDSFAVSLGTNYLTSWASGVGGAFSTGVGVMIKIGPAEEVGERIDIGVPNLSRMSGDLMYTNFAALYWASVALGGYLPGDETFDEGDGIRFHHRYRSVEDGDIDEIEFSRALLDADGEGSQWWRIEFFFEEDDLAFEVRVRDDGGIELMRYVDPSTEEVTTYTPTDPYLWRSHDDVMWTEEELRDYRVGSEEVTVPAGTFTTERIEATEDEFSYTWWMAENVPGRVVRFAGTAQDGSDVSGELLEILRDVTSPWGSPR